MINISLVATEEISSSLVFHVNSVLIRSS